MVFNFLSTKGAVRKFLKKYINSVGIAGYETGDDQCRTSPGWGVINIFPKIVQHGDDGIFFSTQRGGANITKKICKFGGGCWL